MDTKKTLLAEITMATRWGDQDKYGHINNTVFFRYIEEARVCWFNSIGFAVDGKGEGPILLKTGATFHRELNYPTNITIKTYALTPGNSSLPMQHEIVDASNGELYCTVDALVVWYEHASKKSIPLHHRIREEIANRYNLRNMTEPAE
ncbi:MAG: acyl-CoA thioesterase [Hahellaceae bacterium]|nr:acyl-CoA thioesterase [Hahellaceae bacterium]MCP5212172.1 acyl-CoA thioesterase [Hahellaceae bacterium]